jgi:hypothetical protein
VLFDEMTLSMLTHSIFKKNRIYMQISAYTYYSKNSIYYGVRYNIVSSHVCIVMPFIPLQKKIISYIIFSRTTVPNKLFLENVYLFSNKIECKLKVYIFDGKRENRFFYCKLMIDDKYFYFFA